MEDQTLSHYRVLEKLGGGGMGVVYKALDTKLNRHVALKFLPPELTRDDEARERFMREAQAASALDHPNICTIYEIDNAPDGQLFIAMGYYEGETLRERIAKGALPIDEALNIAIQVAQGLSKAHAAGIVHRDVKPANVIITTDGLVKIVDFGIAKLLGVTGPTQTGTTLGTVSYMSPEQVAGDDADQQSDVWSLGAVFYEMLTGQQPFTGENQWAVMNAITNRAPEPPLSLREEIPPAVEDVVLRALEKPKDRRYGSTADLLTEVRACHAELTQPVSAIRSAPNPWQVLSRPKVIVPGLLVVLLLGTWGYFSSDQGAEVRLAREEVLPEIARLIEQADYVTAIELAEQTEAIVPDDPDLAALWSRMSIERGFDTAPSGVEVYVRGYAATDREWSLIGQTPIDSARVPLGLLRWRFEGAGVDPTEAARFAAQMPAVLPLPESGSVPGGSVEIPPGRLFLNLTGFDHDNPLQVDAYFIDAYEVTNAEFKEFVEGGGYEQRELWQHPFVNDGQVLPWDEAMSRFRDQTGRPGPSTWQVGSYPDGQEDYPVGGVSWYEAAAYAEFRGESLPTIYHWVHAADPNLAAWVTPLSNFGGEGPSSIGTAEGVSAWGTYDMAGNVREWVWNEAEPGRTRYILGGSWGDQDYQFHHADAQSPFDRSPQNGFRLARYSGEQPTTEALTRPVRGSFRDYTEEESVSDEVFEVYRTRFFGHTFTLRGMT